MELRPRRAASLLAEARETFRVVVVNGPRQSGKSTLLNLTAKPAGAEVVTLDDRAVLRLARTDPAGLVHDYPKPLFVDEVQRGGDPLVLAIKAWVDRHARQRGQFILAGSSRFLTVPTLSESLAGRVRIVDLFPFSQGEIEGTSDGFVDLVFNDPDGLRDVRPPALRRVEAMERVVRGGFPPVQQLESARSRAAWFADYQRTLVQRDLAELRRVRQAVEVPRLIRLLAGLSGSELNMSLLARGLDLTGDTIRSYLALLETIYVHHTLPAWSAGFVSRAKRRPKIHFIDSGLAAAALGMNVERLSVPTEPRAGPLLESFVVGELARQRTWAETPVDLFHFRDREQREVDVVLESADGRVVGVEVKAAIDIDEADTRWLRWLRDHLGQRFVHGVVLHLGDRPLPFGDRITGLPLAALWRTG